MTIVLYCRKRKNYIVYRYKGIIFSSYMIKKYVECSFKYNPVLLFLFAILHFYEPRFILTVSLHIIPSSWMFILEAFSWNEAVTTGGARGCFSTGDTCITGRRVSCSNNSNNSRPTTTNPAPGPGQLRYQQIVMSSGDPFKAVVFIRIRIYPKNLMLIRIHPFS